MTQIDSNKIINATKWSSITEIIAKIINPITSMVLARLLTPEAFGVVATLSMIITFVEIFTDAGFQKYLIQHNFKNITDLYKSTNVAFWSNLVLSFVLWGVIALFSEKIAYIVGNPGIGSAISIACISIPLVGLSSIQQSLFKREFDFKTLFNLRLISIATPLIVTIPLAISLKNYWALVIGTILSHSVNVIFITIKSKWKPTFDYDFGLLKKMLSFSIWTVLESISIWLTLNIDIFIVGTFLNPYYLGVYKTSMTLVTQILGIVSGMLVPVLFSSLSRLQNDLVSFRSMFYKFQKLGSIILLPMGLGVMVFRKTIVEIMLGKQWEDAVGFVGLWAFTTVFVNLFSTLGSEVYRALGKPQLSTFAQILHIVCLCPVVLIAVHYDFESLYISRSLVRFQMILVNIVLVWKLCGISFLKSLNSIRYSLFSSVMMSILGYFLINLGLSNAWNILFIIICASFYILCLLLRKEERYVLMSIMNVLKFKKTK